MDDVLTTFGPAGLAIFIIWLILEFISNWKLLKKAGHLGFQSIIPIWNIIARFGISWSKMVGLVFVLVDAVAAYMLARGGVSELSTISQVIFFVMLFGSIILYVIEKFKLSRSFGHGFFFGLGLLLLEPVFIMILAFGKSEYVGRGGRARA